jgi:hypothetical protein
MNVHRSFARRLVALSLVAAAWTAGATALAQTSPGTLDGDAAAGHGRDRCPSLFDGRGERVLIEQDRTAVGSSFSRDCPSYSRRSPRADAEQPNAAQKPQAAEHDLAVPGLAAGSVQVDEPAAAEQGENAPLAVRITPGRLSATVLTSGTAIWLLQSGFWTSLLILGLPIWRHVDLLPIVDAASDDQSATNLAAQDADEERAVARVLQAQGPQQTGTAERR